MEETVSNLNAAPRGFGTPYSGFHAFLGPSTQASPGTKVVTRRRGDLGPNVNNRKNMAGYMQVVYRLTHKISIIAFWLM